jgi:hypothetical protein
MRPVQKDFYVSPLFSLALRKRRQAFWETTAMRTLLLFGAAIRRESPYQARAGTSANRTRTAIIREMQSELPRRAGILQHRNTSA